MDEWQTGTSSPQDHPEWVLDLSSPGLLRSPGGGRPGAMPAVFSRPSLPELKPRDVPCPTACWAVPRAGTLQEAPMGDIPMSSFCSRGCDQAQPSPVLLQGWGWGGNHPSAGFGEQIHAEWVVVWGCPQHLPVPHVGAGPQPAQGLCRDLWHHLWNHLVVSPVAKSCWNYSRGVQGAAGQGGCWITTPRLPFP